MRALFPGHYRPSEQELKKLWDECTFAFDANVLLNLYRYNLDTRNRLLGQFRKLRGRIWLPYQAAKEYQDNRLTVIAQQTAAYDELSKQLNVTANKVKAELEHYERHAVIDAATIERKLADAFKQALDSLETSRKSHPDFSKGDEVRDVLSALFTGANVGGKKGAAERLKAAERRLAEGRPPGGRDREKGGTKQYGDAVIWLELLEHAKATTKPLIFVTDDRKDDWWQEVRGKKIGPRPELVEEMADSASARFYMYQPDVFMQRAAQVLKEASAKDAVEEVRRVREASLEEDAESAYRRAVFRDLEQVPSEKRVEYLKSSFLADELRTMFPHLSSEFATTGSQAGVLGAGDRLEPSTETFISRLHEPSANAFARAVARRQAARLVALEKLALHGDLEAQKPEEPGSHAAAHDDDDKDKR